MTEKEKRDSGVLYNAGSDPELISEVMRAKKLCHEYNSIDPTDFDAQEAVLKKLLGKTGKRFHVYPPFWCDYGYNIELGEDFFANHGTVMLDGGKITFGNNVLVGPGCGFHTAGHPIDKERRNDWQVYNKPITVGNNVWFGAGVQVMPGVTIGNDCVIGAGSIVVSDIPDGSIAVGNPCKVIRPITDEDRKKVYGK